LALIGDLKAPKGVSLGGRGRVGDLDRFVRPLGFEAQSRADATRLSPRAAGLLDAFAEGVNAALHAMRGAYPPEYLLVGAPRAWQPADSLLTGRACAFVVSLTGFENERAFDAVRGERGDDFARRLYPEAPWDRVPTSYRVGGGEETPEAPLGTVAAGSAQLGGERGLAPGHGCSPTIRTCRSFRSRPSGTTSTCTAPTIACRAACSRDFPRSASATTARSPGAARRAFATRSTSTASIACPMIRRATAPSAAAARSPSSARSYPRASAGRSRSSGRRAITASSIPTGTITTHAPLAVRVVPSDLATCSRAISRWRRRRRSRRSAPRLARCHDGPFDFNLVYGHRDGTIAWELFGRAPRRRRGHLRARRRRPGRPVGRLDPVRRNAEAARSGARLRGHRQLSHRCQCAPIFTATHSEPRYRTNQIEARIRARGDHDVDSVAAIQRDVSADYAPALRDAMLAAIGAVTGNDVALRALAILRAWDGAFGSDSAGAALFALLHQDLPSRVFVPLLGASLGKRFAQGRRAMPRVHQLLLDPADALRTDVERASGRSVATLVREAFFAVVERLSASQGTEPTAWRWGAVQRVWLGTPLGLLPLLGRRFVALDAEFPGDEYTISPSRAVPVRGTHYALVGATSRFICDLARPDEALFAHSAGPSADFRNPLFRAGAESWQRFEYFRSALWEPADVPNVIERLEG
jgi:penicillin amidase